MVGLGVAVGLGVDVGTGVLVGLGGTVGTAVGVGVGRGVDVGVGVGDGDGVGVTVGAGVSVGTGVSVGSAAMVAAKRTSTVASMSGVDAGRTLAIGAGGTAVGVGRAVTSAVYQGLPLPEWKVGWGQVAGPPVPEQSDRPPK